MSAGPSILEGDALGSFGIDCADSKNYCGYPQWDSIDVVTAAPEFPDWTAPEAPSFILDEDLWKSIGSRQIHVRFQATYDQGRWLNRIGTTCPSASTGPRGQTSNTSIALEMTDKKSKRITDVVDVKHLLPAPPAKKDVLCVPLQGDHRSVLARVIKINKNSHTATLVHFHANSGSWDESLDNLCWVGSVWGIQLPYNSIYYKFLLVW